MPCKQTRTLTASYEHSEAPTLVSQRWPTPLSTSVNCKPSRPCTMLNRPLLMSLVRLCASLLQGWPLITFSAPASPCNTIISISDSDTDSDVYWASRSQPGAGDAFWASIDASLPPHPVEDRPQGNIGLDVDTGERDYIVSGGVNAGFMDSWYVISIKSLGFFLLITS